MSAPLRVFISYASHDREFVRRLADDLEKNGVPTWVDRVEVRAGDPIATTIHQAIRESRAMISVISRESVKSKWVHEELSAAAYRNVNDGGSFLVPIVIDDAELPAEVAYRRFVDFRHDYDDGLRELLAYFGTTRVVVSSSRPRSRMPIVIAASLVILVLAAVVAWKFAHRSQNDVVPTETAADRRTAPSPEPEPQRGRWIYIGSYDAGQRQWTTRTLDAMAKPPQGLRCSEAVIAGATGKVNVHSLPTPKAETVGQLDPGAAMTLREIFGDDNGPQWARIEDDAPDPVLAGDVIDFTGVDTYHASGHVVPADPTLHDQRIRAKDVRPDNSELVVKHPLALYKGQAVHQGRNVFTQDVQPPAPVTFTLVFAEPVRGVGIMRAALYGESGTGISHPKWSAHALDAEGREIASTGEPFLNEHCDVRARMFVLEASGAQINAVRFDSDFRRPKYGGAAFTGVLIDELILRR